MSTYYKPINARTLYALIEHLKTLECLKKIMSAELSKEHARLLDIVTDVFTYSKNVKITK